MRHLIISIVALVLPYASMAQQSDVSPTMNRWHICEDDIDCKLVEGVCGPTGVNVGHVKEATRYYEEQRETIKCGNEFWRPRYNAVRCRNQSCEGVVE